MIAEIIATLGDLVNAEAALARLSAQPVSIAMAYRISKLQRVVSMETQFFHAQRASLIRQLGEAHEVTTEQRAQGITEQILVKSENKELFNAGMDELASIRVTLPVPPLSLSALSDILISANDLDALDRLIVHDSRAHLVS